MSEDTQESEITVTESNEEDIEEGTSTNQSLLQPMFMYFLSASLLHFECGETEVGLALG